MADKNKQAGPSPFGGHSPNRLTATGSTATGSAATKPTSTVSTATGSAATGSATTGMIATTSASSSAVQDDLQQWRQRINSNQIVMQRNIELIVEDTRQSKDNTAKQFSTINETLSRILESITATNASSATGSAIAPDAAANEAALVQPSISTASAEFHGFPPHTSADASSHSSNASTVSTDSLAGNHTAGVFAPRAARKLHDLPLFSGAPEEWLPFHTMFVQTTEAYGYSQLDNSIRLSKCLIGAAKEAVDCLLLDGNNTHVVIETLQFRFGQPELLAQVQLRRVRDIPAIPESHPELLVPYASKVSNMLTYIDQPRTRQYLNNPELLEQLVLKLPMSRRHEWGRFAVSIIPYATIQHFSDWLMDLARCVSRMTPASVLASATLPTTAAVRPSQTSNRRERTMHVTVSSSSCEICSNGGHNATNCRQFARKTVADRWDIVRSKGLCFSCLCLGHQTANCPNKVNCSINNCDRPHHNLLHSTNNTTTIRRNPFARGQQTATPASTSAASSVTPITEAPDHATTSDDTGIQRVHNCRLNATVARILFRIVPVKLYGVDRVLQTYALLDEGSSVTLLDDSLATELGLTGPRSALGLQWFGGRSASELSRSVSLRISGVGHDPPTYNMSNVRTVPTLDLPAQTIAMDDLTERHQLLRGLPVMDYRNAVPKILIGLDNAHLGISTRQVSCVAPGPVATRTKLGWVVWGPTTTVIDNTVTSLHIHNADSSKQRDELLHHAVAEYFSIESFGVRLDHQPLDSPNDARAKAIMQQTTTRINGRYETGLLWKRNSVSLSQNKDMAIKRLESVERKMARDRTYAVEYRAIMDGYIAKGYARRLSNEEESRVDNRTWFLPHFAVTNPNKPGKIRIVFDAAAESNGVSLNSVLLKGPDMNRPLLSVLHRFRIGTVGVCADIKEMFLQIRIRSSDVNAQRFLWRNGDTSRPMDVYVMQSMIFGAACSPCSAQFVKNSNADLFADRFPDAVKMIKEAHYVDDLVASFDTADEAARVTKEIVGIHKHGGFELRGFLSNSPAVLSAIGGEQCKSALNMQLDGSSADKILGMYWCTKDDVFLFKLAFSRVDAAVVDGSRRPTKRELLSAVMSIYDPFGILAVFTIYAKAMLQDLWRHGSTWDEPIPDDIGAKWQQWVAKLDECRQVRVPRCYVANIKSKRVQLHIFADASQSAMAAVAYWRVELAPSRWTVAFIIGKARCAPPKLISVPRLELQASMLAIRLNKCIRALHADIAVDRTFFWSDSKTVVHWVRSQNLQFRPFVEHRIAEIWEQTSVSDWRWLPTHLNAADDATRAKYPIRFRAENRWIRGPEFLRQAEEQWPVEPAQTLCEEGAEEVKPHSVHLVCPTTNVNNFQITRFSNFNRACRAMAFVLRFVRNLRTSTKSRGELLPDELVNAERRIILDAQRDGFAAELAAIRRGEQIERSSSIHCLMPHIDQHGILRVTGRMNRAAHLPEDTRNPIILPKNHHLTTIIVAMYHQRLRHQQQAAVVCEVRQRFWVPHLKVIVRRVKSQCMYCRVRAAQAVVPVMGQLPTDRLTPFIRPFTYTGVDYFGPLFVTIGRRREKRWVCLFTCMTIRAVHLEIATDLSTDACMLCIRNFMNVRGVPKRIRSDNGTNFVGASRELKTAIELLDHAAIQRELSVQRVEWRFNCPGNPEAGGCWERLVQSVKRVLSVTLTEMAPQVETLRSLLLESANIVNSRPLTDLPVNGDEDEPLTPNHFLLGTSNSTQTPGMDDDKPICMRKQWRIAQAMKNRFWKRWLLEYMPDLTRRAKGHTEQPQLVVGALVLMCDPLLPRGQWRRGRIAQVYPGSDGRIRTALVKTTDGDFKRPVTKLAVLDVL